MPSQLDAKAHQFLSIIQKDSQAMLQFIDNLISLSRFEHREIPSSNINMMELAETVLSELSNYTPETPEIRHELRIEVLPPAYGDRMMVRQVFFNLLSNAIKFSGPRETPLIEIGCIAGDEQNTYYIRDNGVGFDMQHAQQLFGLFQRFHPSDQFEGTGIGLAIVQRIIQRQGGKMWAEGEIGKGATFYFALPKGH
jgi:light-regulated signal transduction histidine kinase (bacteriophytochrome)